MCNFSFIISDIFKILLLWNWFLSCQKYKDKLMLFQNVHIICHLPLRSKHGPKVLTGPAFNPMYSQIYNNLLLGPMEQRPRGDIVLTCVVLHTIWWHTREEQTVHQPQQMMQQHYKINRRCMCRMRITGILWGRSNINKNYSKTTSITWGHWLSRGTGSKMCQPTTLGAETGIYQSF